MSYNYNHAILGGTFDHFHIGHEKLIENAFNKSEKVTIGIVEKIFPSNKYYKSCIEEFSTRLESLKAYLSKQGLESRSSIIPINDIYGTSLIDSSIEAIFVTDSTLPNAKIINNKRLQIGMHQLEIAKVSYVLGDDNQAISSGRIRDGSIDRNGHSYMKFFKQKEVYLLPKQLRKSLQKPLGKVVKSATEASKLIPATSLTISIGDIVSIDLKKINFPTALCIIDYKTRRMIIDEKEMNKYFPYINKVVQNLAGTINVESANIILSSLSEYEQSNQTQLIKVVGEEDLLALPVLLLSPLGSYVIYGQYQVGMIVVEVTEEIKNLAKKYLEQFD